MPVVVNGRPFHEAPAWTRNRMGVVEFHIGRACRWTKHQRVVNSVWPHPSGFCPSDGELNDKSGSDLLVAAVQPQQRFELIIDHD